MNLPAWFEQWANETLGLLSSPHTQESYDFLAAWHVREDGRFSGAEYNPLNTEWKMPGSTDFNSAGVQNFTSVTEGAEATARTLQGNPGYRDLLLAFRSGHPNRSATYVGLSTWSGGSYSTLNGVEIPPPAPAEPTPAEPTPAPSPTSNGESLVSLLPTLKLGSEGEAVRRLQAVLTVDGHPLAVDGVFGTETESAVSAFQRENSVPDSVKSDGNGDGIVGPKTWESLLTYKGGQ